MLLTLLTLLTPHAHAGDVLVPEATPAQLSDFSVSYLFYDMVLGQLRDRGLNVQDADGIRPWAGSDGDACYDNPDCPRLLWDHDAGGSVLVVLGVGQTEGGLEVTAKIYGAGQDEPEKVVHETIASGSEEKLAAQISGIAARIAGGGNDSPARIPVKVKVPPDDDKRNDEKRDDEKRDDEKRDDEKRDDEKRDDEKPVARKPKAPDAPRDSSRDEQSHMGVPGWAYTKFRQSGLSRTDWLRQKRVRTGKVSLEFNAGYGIGDVGRGYGVRALVEDRADGFQTTSSSTEQGPGVGAGFSGSVGVAYNPASFLETSLQAGLILGKKYLNVGWECTTCANLSDERDYDAVNSVEGFVEPRVRVLPIATGYVKPYALLGLHLRLWDGFSVPDGSSVDYPNIPGGAGVGLVVGGGVSFDVLPEMSFVIEAPYSITLANGTDSVDSDAVTAEPTALKAAAGLFRVTGGVALRF